MKALRARIDRVALEKAHHITWLMTMRLRTEEEDRKRQSDKSRTRNIQQKKNLEIYCKRQRNLDVSHRI